MIADYDMGMPTTSLVPDCKLLNPNVGGKNLSPFVIGRSSVRSIVGSILAAAYGLNSPRPAAQAIFAFNRFIASVTMLGTVLM